jgi:cardiolipin synthase
MNDIWRYLIQDRADVTLSVGLVLAVAVTLHILLTKREVASAVGWIGLVWFAPVLGAITYAMFGVNRVRRRAHRLRKPDANPAAPAWPSPNGEDGLEPLEHGVARITGRKLAAGTTVRTYHNGDQAYPPMLDAIAAATTSVGLSSYIFQNDRWGGRFIEALIQAHQRGVAVRVLIDGIGGGWLTSPTYHRLRRAGVPADRFMHSLLPWRMPFVNLRNHKKIMLIDGTTAFTGGMNIADDNVMATRPKTPVQDLHFRIDGPVVAQLAEAFADDWGFVANEDLEGDAWAPEIAPRPGPNARVIDSGPDEDLEKVEFAVLQAVSCARSGIDVMTPYFLPDERLITALALAAMRGVAVNIVVPQKSNHALVDWATRPNILPLLPAGVRIWRSPAPFHHSKMMVVDGEWCLIGSTNWDIRSFRLNFELCMEVYDPDLAATLLALMQPFHVAELTQAELDARPLPSRIRDSAARLMLPYL